VSRYRNEMIPASVYFDSKGGSRSKTGWLVQLIDCSLIDRMVQLIDGLIDWLFVWLLID
jgi:hypothetical protein